MAHDGFTNARIRAEFLGMDFTPLHGEAALAAIAARASAGGPFSYVVTPNVAHVVDLDREPETRARLYAEAWLTLNGSRVLEMLARIAGLSIPVARGSDLAAGLFSRILHPDEPVCIIGGDAGLVAAIAARYGLNNVQWRAQPAGLVHNPEAVDAAAAFVARTRARCTFFCAGAPEQEMIARAVLRRGDATGVGLCIGASLEHLAGRAPRAPEWMRAVRLEWLHRLAREPHRLWRRALIDGPRIAPIFYYWMLAQLSERASISARSAF